MRAVITGAAGFIGSHLSERLVAEGVDVVGIDAFTDFYDRPAKEHNLRVLATNPAFRLIEADLRTDDVDAHLEGADVIVHLAAQPGVRDSWGRGFEVYVGHNVLATQRVLRRAGAGGVDGAELEREHAHIERAVASHRHGVGAAVLCASEEEPGAHTLLTPPPTFRVALPAAGRTGHPPLRW